MTHEKKDLVVKLLAESHPCNTSNDFSLSIIRGWNKNYHIYVYPNEDHPFFTEYCIQALLGIAQVMNLNIAFRTINDVTICSLS